MLLKRLDLNTYVYLRQYKLNTSLKICTYTGNLPKNEFKTSSQIFIEAIKTKKTLH